MNKLISIIAFWILFGGQGKAQEGFSSESLVWEKVTSFPKNQETGFEKGFAGIYAGKHNGIIILAGGANFPENPPSQGGIKKYWDQISLLKKDEAKYLWKSLGEYKLPKPLAYGASVSSKDGLILIGGENENGVHSDVLKLSFRTESNQLEITSLPDLPWPMAYTSAVIHDEVIYLAGSLNSNPEGIFLRYDLKSPNSEWESLPTWPGPPRNNLGLVLQSDGESEKIYLIGGRFKGNSSSSQIYSDNYSFDPIHKQWTKRSSIQTEDGQKFNLSAFTADPLGSGHILLIGGVQPEPFNTQEKLQDQILSLAQNSTQRDSLIQLRDSIQNYHPGFSKTVLAYHTVTDSWTMLEDLPFPGPVNTTLLTLDNSALLISGETAPGHRTPDLYEFNLITHQTFGTLNYTILIGYLGILVLIGIWVSRKQHDASDYFKAGGRVPWWAAGISVFGTQLSAITFMAIPAKTFSTDWTLFFLLLTIIMISPIIIAWFLPFFRRLNLTTAYEYL